MRTFFLAATCLAAQAWVAVAPCTTADQAKAIAEIETGGEAVTALEIITHDASQGWLVDVHMPGETRGWRCTVDRDLAKVRYKEAIKNPPSRIRKFATTS